MSPSSSSSSRHHLYPCSLRRSDHPLSSWYQIPGFTRWASTNPSRNSFLFSILSRKIQKKLEFIVCHILDCTVLSFSLGSSIFSASSFRIWILFRVSLIVVFFLGSCGLFFTWRNRLSSMQIWSRGSYIGHDLSHVLPLWVHWCCIQQIHNVLFLLVGMHNHLW
jgi:hypothetical protein